MSGSDPNSSWSDPSQVPGPGFAPDSITEVTHTSWFARLAGQSLERFGDSGAE